MFGYVKLLLVMMLGLGCIIVGIAGLVLPIIPGIPLILLGLVLILGREKMQKMREHVRRAWKKR
jgi:uncharacterized protein YqgC (DUF456 family)